MMGRAYKCDRCGELYEKPGTPRRKIEITDDLHPFPERRLELCWNCQYELIKWLNAKGADFKEGYE